jgi:AcrR family transcriptional regulator
VGDNTDVTDDDLRRRRRTPSQERSRGTVEAICTAAAMIMQEDGVAALTTNAVAKRAGVSITAVYAYFPDKWAIVHELFERFERLRGQVLVDLFADFDTVEDWPPVIDETWDRMARFRIEVPGGVAIRRALYSEPRLAALEFQGNVRAATIFSRAMVARRPGLDPDQAYRAAWAVALIAGVLLDDAVRSGEVDWDQLAEGKRIVKLYVASFLDREA